MNLIDTIMMPPTLLVARVIRLIARSVGGDFWLYCPKCGGVLPMTPKLLRAHVERHEGEEG